MQWNTGFRYLLPLVPFIFLSLCDHLVRLPKAWLVALSVPVLVHSWVLCMFREPVPESWRRFLAEGVQLPWLTVLRQTRPEGSGLLANPLLPSFILASGAASLGAVWHFGTRDSRARLTLSTLWKRPPGKAYPAKCRGRVHAQ
jgi:hypothetical protein